MAQVQNQPQYQIYLDVLQHLKDCGYQTEEYKNTKKCVGSFIKKDYDSYGEVFVVVSPSSLGVISEAIANNSELSVMREMVETRKWQFYNDGYKLYKDFNPGKCFIRDIWSRDGLVCCLTSTPKSAYPVDEWIELILSNFNQFVRDGKRSEMPISYPPGEKRKSGCYVATAVYGSYNCPEVIILRRYRDNVLSTTYFGRAFIRAYYTISPVIVQLFGKNAWFNNLCKPMLDKLINRLLLRHGSTLNEWK